MKRLLIFVFLLCNGNLMAQDCAFSTGTKTLYTPRQVAYTNPPAGYEPVFINHVGRHGARHLTKDVNTAVAYKLLMKADSMHVLTNEGERLKKMVLLLRTVELPGLKSISDRGKKELEGIATRMVKNNAKIFTPIPPGIKVEITKELRTSQSADAFLGELNLSRGVAIHKIVDDTALRFYDLSPAYLNFENNGTWQRSLFTLEAAQNKEAVFKNFIHKFFSADFVLSAIEKDEFYKDIYGFLTILPSINAEVKQAGFSLSDFNFKSFFSCAQLAYLSKVDEAEDFLLKGAGNDAMGLQVKIAAPLLVQFINTSDEFIKGNHIDLQLRFAHAETISPFASLMQIEAASQPVSNIIQFNKTWKATEIIPLSANIQWIFYKKKSSENYLVKFLLNEKEVQLKGLRPTNYPYYTWTQVREFYLRILHTLHIGLTDNMSAYLNNLK